MAANAINRMELERMLRLYQALTLRFGSTCPLLSRSSTLEAGVPNLGAMCPPLVLPYEGTQNVRWG